jgi:uncharacterized protein YggE
MNNAIDTLHLITVRETSTANVTASGAKLTVRIAGQSLFMGNEAFKKAAEVANLVATLRELGLTETDIQLLNVSTDVESGMLTKSSSATYFLQINCSSIELLGRILSKISSQKNAKLSEIVWQYPDLEKHKRELVQAAVHAAKDAAIAIAESLAVTLQGVHRLSYEMVGLDRDLHLLEDHRGPLMRTRTMQQTAPLDSLDLSHEGKMTVIVTAEFIIGDFTTHGS